MIASHSPIVLAYPGARIYACSADGVESVAFADAAPVRLTQSLLEAPERFLGPLFADEPDDRDDR